MLCIAPLASAAPICVMGTLASYEALGGGGCTIGTNIISGFNTPSGITGATAIAPGTIEITPSGGTSSPTLTFSTSATASNGAIFEALINYSIAGDEYTSDTMMLSGSSSSGNGDATDIQNYCLGGKFDSTGVSNCSSFNTGDLLVLGNGSDAATFAATASLSVTHDLTFDSGGVGVGNTASGGTVMDTYTATPATTGTTGTPEPAAYLLLAAGLILLTFLKTNASTKEKGN